MTKATSTFRGGELLDPDLPVYNVVAYPYSSNIEIVNGELQPCLSYLSKLAVQAAEVVLRAHPEARVIFPGETLYGSSLPNTTDLMAQQAIAYGVDRDSIVRLNRLPNGKNLNNTYRQVAAVRNYLADITIPAATNALNYHLPRVRSVSKAYKVNSNYCSVESILGADAQIIDQNKLSLINSLGNSGLLSERNLRLAGFLGPKGKLLDLLSGDNKGRIVDIVSKNGEYVLESDYATSKYNRLKTLQK